MNIIDNPQEVQKLCTQLRRDRKKIGLVPTMGALHEGHLALLKRAKETCDITVMSIFVNPKQFGKNEDLNRYPRPFEKDCQLAKEQGCDIVFAPIPEFMYPSNFMTHVAVDKLTSVLEGAQRPGHFTGVTTIVLKLFNIVMPDSAVFGQKDAQQVLVLKRMVMDLNLPVQLDIVPTQREKDGLAISSRNSYLTPSERAEVPLIYAGLIKARDAWKKGDRKSSTLIDCIRTKYNNASLFTPEYVSIVDTNSLLPLETISDTALIATACKTAESQTRLIDNIVLNGSL